MGNKLEEGRIGGWGKPPVETTGGSGGTPALPSGMVELANGEKGLRGTLQVAVEVGAEEGIVDFLASDETLDRVGEIIAADGWELENYRKNPVFQNSHRYGDIIFTLGRALVTEVRKTTAGVSYLYQRVKFAVEANPMAKIAHDLYRGGFLNAVSVGFIPKEWEDGEKAKPAWRKFTRQELVEVSAVAVPANPNALVMGVKSGAVAKDDLEELYELLKAICSREDMLKHELQTGDMLKHELQTGDTLKRELQTDGSQGDAGDTALVSELSRLHEILGEVSRS